MEKGKVILDYATRPRFGRTHKWLRRALWLGAIATVIVGMTFGWLYWGWYSEQGAIRQIKAKGGGISTQQLEFPLRRLVPCQLEWVLDRVDKVCLGNGIRDNDLILLKQFTQLECLMNASCSITDKGMSHLAGLKHLYVLSLSRTNISDEGLKQLKSLKELRALYLISTRVTDQGMEYLKELPELRYLSLGITRITDKGLKQIKQLPKLQSLDLVATDVTKEGIAELQAALPNCKIQR